MDYDFSTLGTRSFEHLAQSLVAKIVGPKLTVMGDGPDGGREATWNGFSPTFGSRPDWDGYGVLQAKYKVHPSDPAENLTWLKSSIRQELLDWAKPDSNRHKNPDYLLFVSNVRLSPSPGNGKDALAAYIDELIQDFGLPILECRVWDSSDLMAQLDAAESIRKRYAAFLTSGDIISKLLEEVQGMEKSFADALSAYTARCIDEESALNLTQAGTADDRRVTIDKVFIDLPAHLPVQFWLNSNGETDDHLNEPAHADDDSEFWPSRSGITAHLINDFNHIAESRKDGQEDPLRTVLIGGPGQGKSTVTQWLAQLYRIEFLKGSRLASTPMVDAATKAMSARSEELELPRIEARRWPVRIVLTEFADYLDREPSHSLLHYIASKVTNRSSFEVQPSMMRTWLTNYPWLLLIDGLDEVPVSSNRRQVVAAIQDFFLETATVGGDVAALATTRPQGYGDEFSSEEYRHFRLSSLEIDEALKYADGLVSVRFGSGTSTAQKVMDRLHRASREEHTSKLFESPLQVTILEVLLEKVGKAPSDRSRLYSSYFNVISQREQEKSDELSELIQKYETDVVFLHRRIGYELQKRGSNAGETSASLSISEFNSFIVERFTDQGHTEEAVKLIERDFTRLVTDRLVFLSKTQSERIGFELRSLQEFMASEYFVNLKESEVMGEIQKISTSPYWRNVVLFAIGSIFAHRDHLRAEVALLCDRLEDEPQAARVVLPGAALAIDILRDGSCLHMPVYARPLAKTALKYLDAPYSSRVTNLKFFQDLEFADILWSKIEDFGSVTLSNWLNRAVLLSSMSEASDDRASVLLRQLYVQADAVRKRHVIEMAAEKGDAQLGEVIGGEFTICSVESLLSSFHRNPHWGYASRMPEGTKVEWMRQLSVIAIRPQSRIHDREFSSDGVTLLAEYRPLGEDRDAWKWVADIPSDAPDWVALKSLATFALEPSANSLANLLEEMAALESPLTPLAAPWPYVACIRYANDTSRSGSDTSVRSVLLELASAARRGDMGDFDSWSLAQDRWPTPMIVTEDVVNGSSTSTVELPLWPDLALGGNVPRACAYTLRHGNPESSDGDVRQLVKILASKDDGDPTWLNLATFLATALERQDDATPPLGDEGLFELIGCRLIETGFQPNWISWINLLPPEELPSHADVLRRVGSHDWMSGAIEDASVDVLLQMARESDDGLPFARIALRVQPGEFQRISDEELEVLIGDSDPKLTGVLAASRLVIGATQDEIWSGVMDAQIRAIVASTDVILGQAWFATLLRSIDLPIVSDIGARGALLISDDMPYVAERWLRIATARGKVEDARIVS